MRETKFIEQNKEKWAQFEQLAQNKKNENIDELSRLYVEITDDLSYAKTFFPNRSVTVYLNNLSQKIFKELYSKRRKKKNLLGQFFAEDLPKTMYLARKEMLISFLVFLAAVLVGVFSSLQDPDFPTDILGSGYIEMTKENIASGEPMGVYQKDDATGMFWRIFLNNLRVDFITFVHGIFFSIGSCFILIKNGIMLGSFKTFLYNEGVIRQAFFAVWMHGSIEIPTIIISGAAGIKLGLGLLFPGTHTRLQAFRYSAQAGLKIFFGVAPATFLAAVIEGYLTRYTDIPDLLRGIFIFLAFFATLYYYVIYPYLKFKNTTEEIEEFPNAKPIAFTQFEKGTVFDISSTITHSILEVIRRWKPIILIGIISGIASIIADINLYQRTEYSIWIERVFFPKHLFAQIWTGYLKEYAIVIGVLSGVLQIVLLIIHQKKDIHWLHFPTLIVLNCIPFSALLIPNGFGFWLCLFTFPLFWNWAISIILKNEANISAFKYAWKLTISNLLGNIFITFLAFVIAYYTVMLFDNRNFFGSGLIQYMLHQFLYVIVPDKGLMQTILKYTDQILSVIGCVFGLYFLIQVVYYRYFTLREISQAKALKESISQMTLKSTVYGMEKAD